MHFLVEDFFKVSILDFKVICKYKKKTHLFFFFKLLIEFFENQT